MYWNLLTISLLFLGDFLSKEQLEERAAAFSTYVNGIVFPGSKTIQISPELVQIAFHFILLVVLLGIALTLTTISNVVFTKYFTKVKSHIELMSANRVQIKPDLSTMLCQIRAAFCREFSTHKISISLFLPKRVRFGNSDEDVMWQDLSIDTRGIVTKPLNAKMFRLGEGFCGKAWEQREVVFGRRTFLLIFNYPGYKEFLGQNNSDVNSFCCIPVDIDGNVKAVVTIDSNVSSHFSARARIDKSYVEVAEMIQSMVGFYVINETA